MPLLARWTPGRQAVDGLGSVLGGMTQPDWESCDRSGSVRGGMAQPDWESCDGREVWPALLAGKGPSQAGHPLVTFMLSTGACARTHARMHAHTHTHTHTHFRAHMHTHTHTHTHTQ